MNTNKAHILTDSEQRKRSHFIANISQFFPERDFRQLLELWTSAKEMEGKFPLLTERDQLKSTLYRHLRSIDERQPVMWVAFHMGPYPLLPDLLLALGRRLAVLLSDQAFRLYATQPDWVDQYQRDRVLPINVATPAAVYAIRNAMLENWDIMAFIDGNVGRSGAGRFEVSFGPGKWFLRDVLMRLARKAAYRTNFIYLRSLQGGTLGMQLCKQRSDTDGDPYTEVWKKAFASFEDDLLAGPELWKGWEFIHRDWQRYPVWQIKRPPNIWLPYPVKGDFFALDISSLRYHQIGHKDYLELLVRTEG